jgi:hypothetical protein
MPEHFTFADLLDMGGVSVLAEAMLEGGDMKLQALKALSTAAANNIKFQQGVLAQEAAIVPWLLQVRTYAVQVTAASSC